jgi:hypothetical protein
LRVRQAKHVMATNNLDAQVSGGVGPQPDAPIDIEPGIDEFPGEIVPAPVFDLPDAA